MMQLAYIFFWWLILEVIGLITFPLVSRVCGRLQDKGYSISKLLGLVLLTYFTWLLPTIRLAKFGYISILLSLLLVVALSFLLGRKQLRIRDLPIRSMIVTDVVFTIIFAVFSLVLFYKPDIYFAYSEDFTDFAIIQSILRADYFPPGDAWLAGESISYYYGGHLVVALITQLSRVPPAIAYNLAGAMFFALAVCAAYGLGLNLTRRSLYGALTAIFVLLSGYIAGAFQLIAYFLEHDFLGYSALSVPSLLDWMLSFDFTAANGIISHTLNYYPYYVFMQGDLRAYTVSIPFQLMFITIILAVVRTGGLSLWEGKADYLVHILILGVTLGFFTFVHTWEYPAYLLLTLLSFLLLKIKFDVKSLVAIIGLSLALYAPYLISRGTGGVYGIGLVSSRTSLASFLTMFSLFSFAMLSFFYLLSKKGVATVKGGIIAISVAIPSILIALLLDFQLAFIMVPVLLLALLFLFKSGQDSERGFALVLIITGALMVLFCELFHIKDGFGPPYERFNTVLKLYFPIWLFFGLSSGYAVALILGRSKGVVKALWVASLLLLLLASLIHPIASTTSYTSGRQVFFGVGRGTLDGIAYVETIDKGDYEAILWINDNIGGHPTILETRGDAYQYTSRISALTGLPTVIGWVGHEIMWGRTWDEVGERSRDVEMIYNTLDNDEAMELLRKYDVEYIYIGTVEQERYEEEGLQKFATHLEDYYLVYEHEGVTIFKVSDE